MKKLYLLLIAIVFSNACLTGQTVDYTKASNFYDVVKAYKLSPGASLPDSIKGAVNKEYERNFTIYGPRLFPHGDFSIASNAMHVYFNNFTSGTRSNNCENQYENTTWLSLGPNGLPHNKAGAGQSNGVGRIQRIVFDPDYNGTTNKTIFASSEVSGLWKSIDDGMNWNVLNTDLQLPFASVSDVAIDYNNADNIFISTGMADVQLNSNIEANTAQINPIWTSGIYRSTNGGTDWNPINTGLLSYFVDGGSIRNLKTHPTQSNKIYAATSKGFFYSNNALASNPIWTKVTSGIMYGDAQLRGLELKPNNPNVIYLSGTDIYRSTNSGLNWVSITNPSVYPGLDINNLPDNFTVERINLAVTPDNPDAVFAYIIGKYDYQDNKRMRAYIYKFTGVSWEQLAVYEPGTSGFNAVSITWMGISVSPIDEDLIIFGHTYLKGLKQTTGEIVNLDGYNTEGLHADIHDVKFTPISTNPRLFVATHGGVSEGVIDYNQELSDASVTFQKRCDGLSTSTIWTFDRSLKSEAYVIGHQDNGTSYFESGFPNWRQIGGGDGYGTAISSIVAPRVYLLSGLASYSMFPFIPNSYVASIKPKSIEYPTLNASITKTFPTFHNHLTAKDYFVFSEIYENLKLKESGDTWSDIWRMASDVGNIPIFNSPNDNHNHVWRHQLSEVAASQVNPNIVYVAVGGTDVAEPEEDLLVKPTLLKTETGLVGEGANPNAQKFFDLTPYLPKINSTDDVSPCITGLAVDPENPDKVWITFSGFYADKKVWKSSDGGYTWQNDDPDGSLANLPVNGIVIQDGTRIENSDHRIFIGTDAGVYYKEPGETCWLKYGLIPNVRVTEVKTNVCENTLIASTFGRGLWSVNMPEKTRPLATINISENSVWETPRFFEENLKVEAGATLTVKDFVYMPSSGTIIIEPGGTLIVDGGTITNACGDLWQGIQVWGNSSQHQTLYASNPVQFHQGRAIFKNGAVIENAWEAVRNSKPGDWAKTGGIIQAKNSTFRNCRRMLEFVAYQNFVPGLPHLKSQDKSYFTECTFEKNDDYPLDPGMDLPHPMITLYKVDRVPFYGCNFVNNSTEITSEKLTNAIFSIDASYIIREVCHPAGFDLCPPATMVKNTFKGWHKAIEALGAETTYPILVRNTVFEENMIGIELNGTEYSRVYKNEFKLGAHPFSESYSLEKWQEHLGVFTNNTHHLIVERNDFERQDASSYPSHGVLVYNSEGAANAVYSNTFTDLEIGANGWQINRNTSAYGGVPPGLSGLQFLCNTNSGNKMDFEISRTQSDVLFEEDNSGIRQNQGSGNPEEPAGNIFSNPYPANNIYTHFTVSSDFIYRYYFETDAPSINEITPGSFVQPIQVNTGSNCAVHYTTGLYGIFGRPQLVEAVNEFQSLKYTYGQIIDAGDTPGMIEEIELTWPNDAWDLRDILMQRSPYNSEEVLIEAAMREIMPHAMLLEVFLANPDALQSGTVINTVKDKLISPMPEYMIDMLYASRDETTLRTAMESALGDLFFEVERIQKIVIGETMLEDSTAFEIDSVIYFLSKVKTVEGNYSRVAALSAKGQNRAAVNLLDSMLNNYKVPEYRMLECKAMKSFYQLLGSVESAARNMATLESGEINSLQNIATDPTAGLASQKARNVLCFHYNICYDNKGKPKSNEVPVPKATKEEILKRLNTVSVFPNPTDQYVTIEYSLLKSMEETTIAVYDATGRLLEQRPLGKNYKGQVLLDTRKYANGLIIFEIKQDGKKVSEGKFIVVH